MPEIFYLLLPYIKVIVHLGGYRMCIIMISIFLFIEIGSFEKNELNTFVRIFIFVKKINKFFFNELVFFYIFYLHLELNTKKSR